MMSLLEVDVRRCQILSGLISAWGEPTCRYDFSKHEHEVEIYYFPPNHISNAYHLATFGVSLNYESNYELYLSIDDDCEDATDEETSLLLMNIVDYIYLYSKVLISKLIPPISFAPDSWQAKAFIISQPRDLPYQDVKSFNDEIHIFQLISIHEAEFNFLKANGHSDFQNLIDRSQHKDISLFDPNRPSFV